jgi:hypothetical protein
MFLEASMGLFLLVLRFPHSSGDFAPVMQRAFFYSFSHCGLKQDAATSNGLNLICYPIRNYLIIS